MNALIAAARRVGARAAIVATLPEGMPEERAQSLAASGIAPLLGIEPRYDLPPADRLLLASAKETR